MADGNNIVKRRSSNAGEKNGDKTGQYLDHCESTPNADISRLLLLQKPAASPMEKDDMLYRLKQKGRREELVVWKSPLRTLNYFFHEIFILLMEYGVKLWKHLRTVLVVLSLALMLLIVYHSDGPHQAYILKIEKKLLWCAYWVGLGVLSSIGLGTGLHTFILYLGPHIASVTLAAYECGSLNFPEPPYPDEIICPESGLSTTKVITIWNIMSKVRLEAFMWGMGTALGELPPYFMARAARLSGYDPEDEDLMQLEQLANQQNGNQSALDRAKLMMKKLVERVGFFGILACASIPNPLFDLAGITCGHFLVPFWTFFGATIIGKAIIKMHIQKMFVIIAFNEEMLEKAVSLINYVPYVGKYLQAPFKEFLVKQKAKLHRKAGTPSSSEGSWLGWIFEKFIMAMVIYFILSIISSLAQSYHKRISKRESKERKLDSRTS